MYRKIASLAGALALALAVTGCSLFGAEKPSAALAPAVAQETQPQTVTKTIVQTIDVKAMLDSAKAAFEPKPTPALPTLALPNLPAQQAGPTKIEATFQVPAQNVVFPVGNWWNISLDTILALLGGASGIAAMIYKFLPPAYAAIAHLVLPGLLNKAINAAHQNIPGLQVGDTLSVNAHSTIAAGALQWLADNAGMIETLVMKALGGQDVVEAHIKAMLPLVREAGDPALAVANDNAAEPLPDAQAAA